MLTTHYEKHKSGEEKLDGNECEWNFKNQNKKGRERERESAWVFV